MNKYALSRVWKLWRPFYVFFICPKQNTEEGNDLRKECPVLSGIPCRRSDDEKTETDDTDE